MILGPGLEEMAKFVKQWKKERALSSLGGFGDCEGISRAGKRKGWLWANGGTLLKQRTFRKSW